MKRLTLGFLIALCGVVFVAGEADAKRLGGGTSSGLKRQTPPPQQQQTPPSQQATPNNPGAPANAAAPTAAAGAQAAAPKRSWMGPIAGLAAGLGLAALMSHLGLGAELANFVMLALLAVAAFFLVRFLVRRFAGGRAAPARSSGLQFAGAPAGAGPAGALGGSPAFGSAGGSGFAPPASPAAAAVPQAPGQASVPADFDAAGFERIARLLFIRLQAANDAGDLNDLRRFSTPEMFAHFKLELQDRGSRAQQTDVVELHAQVIDVAQEPDQQVVSVRFRGLVREEAEAAAQAFDEVWHFVRPADGSGEWAIAGIAQTA